MMRVGLMSRSVGAALATAAVYRPVMSVLARRAYATMKYTKDHEWVRVDGEIATIGITNYAQNSLGDLVYVELPEPGKAFAQSDEMGIVESVKAASDVYAPVSGEVTETNTAVVDTPGIINKSAQEDGWLVKMKLTNPSELGELMDEDTYTAHCKEAEDQ